MISPRALRADPRFADLFEHVHVICWPILWWQLNPLRQWCVARTTPDVLYSVTPWGFIKVCLFGAAPDPRAYKPIPRTFRPLMGEGWASSLPINLGGLSPLEAMHILILPRKAGGGGSRQRRESEGALTSPPNTS